MDELDQRIEEYLSGGTELPPSGMLRPGAAPAAGRLAQRLRAVNWFPVRTRVEGAPERPARPTGAAPAVAPYPGPTLVGTGDPGALIVLRALVRREVDSALKLVPELPPVRLREWVGDKLFGTELGSVRDRKVVLGLMAEVIRDALEEGALRTIVPGAPGAKQSTVGTLAGRLQLTTVVSHPSPVAAAVAKGSRTLDRIAPAAGEVFRLGCYGGLSVAEIAPLIAATAEDTENLLHEAEGYIQGQIVTGA